MVNVDYLFDIAPTDKLRDFAFTEVEEWKAGASAMIELFMPELDLAAWIDRYFREVLDCDVDYRLTWKREK